MTYENKERILAIARTLPNKNHVDYHTTLRFQVRSLLIDAYPNSFEDDPLDEVILLIQTACKESK